MTTVDVELSRASFAQLQRLRKLIASRDRALRSGLRQNVSKRLRKEVGPILRKEAKKNASLRLPQRGGLALWVARKSRGSIRTRYSGKTAGIRFTMSRRNASGKLADLNRMDQGRTRHPFWGRWPQPAAKYINQTLQNLPKGKGWFTEIEPEATNAALAAIYKILDEEATKIERG